MQPNDLWLCSDECQCWWYYLIRYAIKTMHLISWQPSLAHNWNRWQCAICSTPNSCICVIDDTRLNRIMAQVHMNNGVPKETQWRRNREKMANHQNRYYCVDKFNCTSFRTARVSTTCDLRSYYSTGCAQPNVYSLKCWNTSDERW